MQRMFLRCDLLSFYYLCRTGNNELPSPHVEQLVVICFHFTIFVVLETTVLSITSGRGVLWFAFILLSLSYWKQRNINISIYRHSCDLLSFYYLCRTGNNNKEQIHNTNQLWFAFILLSLSYWKQQDLRTHHQHHVVICFHFTIFVVLETTLKSGGRYWFCCDLLSFYYLCRTGNNRRCGLIFKNALWFAFILLSLSYWKQPGQWTDNPTSCCDLLSFYYLCRTGNNQIARWYLIAIVVICFHFTIFVVLETTLDDHQNQQYSCDLLSFYYLCRTGNNWSTGHPPRTFVVICFHFTIFVVLETTRFFRLM